MDKKILILEDDVSTAELISFYLNEEGFQTLFALDSHQFVDKVHSFHPDLITIDILLQETDGYAVFKSLKEDPFSKNIPIIFITILEGDEVKGINMGANGYIVKPFTEKELKQLVYTIVNREEPS